MALKIYTKTGDLGKTSLIGGTKVAKNNIRIEAYGTIDELNSFIGLTADQLSHTHSKDILKEVQSFSRDQGDGVRAVLNQGAKSLIAFPESILSFFSQRNVPVIKYHSLHAGFVCKIICNAFHPPP